MIHLRLAPVLYFLFTPVSMAEVLVRFLWLFYFQSCIFPLNHLNKHHTPYFTNTAILTEYLKYSMC